MNVINFPLGQRDGEIDDVRRRLDCGEYLELYIVAVCANGSVRQIEIKQPWIDRLEATGSN